MDDRMIFVDFNSSLEETMTEWFWAIVGAIAGLVLGAILTLLTNERALAQHRSFWIREKLYENYSNAIYYLFKLEISSKAASLEDREVRQHYSEAQRFLHLLSAYQKHRDATTPFQALSDTLATASDDLATVRIAAENPLTSAAFGARVAIVDLMSKDKRLNL
jgi:uncharacterized membrane-anchored protein YhcB (DUF1043 family)